MNREISKKRWIASWVVIGILGALFLMSSMTKFLAGPEAEMATNFVKYGLSGKLILIGAGELVSAILYVVPRTTSLGVLLLSAHMGGAIATHMTHGEPYIFQSIILVLVLLGAWLRYPEAFYSFKR